MVGRNRHANPLNVSPTYIKYDNTVNATPPAGILGWHRVGVAFAAQAWAVSDARRESSSPCGVPPRGTVKQPVGRGLPEMTLFVALRAPLRNNSPEEGLQDHERYRLTPPI
jgi:hypothetical protein